MHCRLKELENYYWRTPVLNKTIKVSNFLVRHLCILKILGEALLEPPLADPARESHRYLLLIRIPLGGGACACILPVAKLDVATADPGSW